MPSMSRSGAVPVSRTHWYVKEKGGYDTNT